MVNNFLEVLHALEKMELELLMLEMEKVENCQKAKEEGGSE